MWKQISLYGFCVAVAVGYSSPSWSQQDCAGPQPADEQTTKFTFDGGEALDGWTTIGDGPKAARARAGR